MHVELKFITPNAAEFIGEMAAICYDGKTDSTSNVKRAVNCKDRGHLSTMRFATAVFNIRGISRACSHQLVRHKHLDYLQRSQRYCKETYPRFVFPPVALETDDNFIFSNFCKAYDTCHGIYELLLRRGVRKEDARFVLPVAQETELNIIGNLQAWQDFIKLRTDPAAQWEVQEVAVKINNILAKEIPELFTEIKT